jgi:guanylate kinase
LASRRGRLIVIAGPSGVGKGSVVKRLLAQDPEGLALSVSATTRPPRPAEVDGNDYFFLAEEAFRGLVDRGEMLEWADVFGNLYGTPSATVDQHLRSGRDVVLEIDVQGAAQVRERAPEALLIFLAPPSLADLERRLRGRGTESEDRLEERLERAAGEIAQATWFDHVVVNDQLERAVDEVADIINASRFRTL